MTTKINAICACGTFNLQVDYPNSSLPLDRALCLCTTCRRLSGTCGISYVAVPTSQTIAPSLFANLTTYLTSDALERYFCSTCGAHVLVKLLKYGNKFHLATAIWDKTEGIVSWTGCKWETGGGVDPGGIRFIIIARVVNSVTSYISSGLHKARE